MAPLISPEFGLYRLVKRIGIGGTAEVFQAIYEGPGGPPSLKPGDTVAIKRALPGIAEEPELAELFVDEGRLGMRLRHPGIARVHDFGVFHSTEESYGDPYLVMELALGHTVRKVLRQLLERGQGAAPTAVAAFGIEVAEALSCIHGLRGDDGRPMQAIHRDVSPHNVVLGPDGTLKLIDFGVAKFQGSARTRTGVIKGKHAYMSPEQAERQPYDQRSDLFSLGVSLWELAAGRRLFRGASVPETVDLIVAGEVPDLAEVAPHLSPELAGIIMRCLSRDPAGRPESAALLVGELRTWLETAAPDTRPKQALAELYRSSFGDPPPPTPVEPAAHSATPARPAGVRPAVVAWSVALLVLAFVASTSIWFIQRMNG